MKHFALIGMGVGVAMALSACGPSIPGPRSPLTLTSADAQPPRPTVQSDVRPPRLPAIGMQQLAGTALWSVQQPGSGRATLRVMTRRGNDGAHADESLQSMLFTLARMLEERLPGYPVDVNLKAESLSFGVAVRSADVPLAMRAIAQVLDGPLDDAVARREMMVDHHEQRRVSDALILRLYESPSEPRIIRSAQALSECRDERFASSDRLVALVGDFDQAEVLAAAGESFASAHEYPRLSPLALRPTLPVIELLTFQARYVEAGLSFAIPRRTHEDFPALRILFLLMKDPPLEIMTSEHAGTLPPVVRTHVETSTHAGVAGMAVRNVAQHTEALLVALFRHARSFTAGPPDADALTRARERLWLRVQSRLDNTPDSFLVDAFESGLTPAELGAQFEALGSFTPTDMLAVARRYLAPERMIVHVTWPSGTRRRLNVVREVDGFRLQVDH